LGAWLQQQVRPRLKSYEHLILDTRQLIDQISKSDIDDGDMLRKADVK
jgi:hypothetical protein